MHGIPCRYGASAGAGVWRRLDVAVPVRGGLVGCGFDRRQHRPPRQRRRGGIDGCGLCSGRIAGRRHRPARWRRPAAPLARWHAGSASCSARSRCARICSCSGPSSRNGWEMRSPSGLSMSCFTAPEEASVIEPPDSEGRGSRTGPCDIDETGPLSMLRVFMSLHRTGAVPTRRWFRPGSGRRRAPSGCRRRRWCSRRRGTGAFAGAERFVGLTDLSGTGAGQAAGENRSRDDRNGDARQRHTPESRAAVATARPMRDATCLSSGSGRMRSGVGSIT